MPQSDNILALCLCYRKFVFEYNGKFIVVFKEVKPILLGPGSFPLRTWWKQFPDEIPQSFKFRFRLCVLLSVLINISFVILLTLFSGSKNRRSSVCLLFLCLSAFSVSFIFKNFTKNHRCFYVYNIDTEDTKSLALTSFSAVIFCASRNNDVFSLQRVRVLVRRELFNIIWNECNPISSEQKKI